MAASATDIVIKKKIFGSWTILIIKSLEDSGLLMKGVSETIKNEANEQNSRFLGMLLGTLGTSLLGNILAGKGALRADKETIRSGQEF